MSGLFITFEGIEGSGKTTLIKRLVDTLSYMGADIRITREPGGSVLGTSIRKILLTPESDGLSDTAELMLFAADRAQHITEVIVPALNHNMIVLCDRFSDATTAYQGYARGIPLPVIEAVDTAARQGIEPDLTVLLDLPVEVGLPRALSRNEEGGAEEARIDNEDMAFHQRVRTGYLAISDKEKHRFLVLDATNEPARLEQQVISELKKRFPHVVV
jgi:dTMP kinase